MPYLFSPPTVDRPVGPDRLWSRFHFQVGQALLKKDGFYTLAEVITDEDFAAADVGYLGGHVYVIDDTEKADLEAAGYGAWVQPYTPVIPPSTDDPPEYGRGAYGTGRYGR